MGAVSKIYNKAEKEWLKTSGARKILNCKGIQKIDIDNVLSEMYKIIEGYGVDEYGMPEPTVDYEDGAIDAVLACVDIVKLNIVNADGAD